MSMEDFITAYIPGDPNRSIFAIGAPECREAIRLIREWADADLLVHTYFDYLAMAGVLRDAYDQGRSDERQQAGDAGKAEHIQNLAAEVAVLNRRLRVTAHNLAGAEEARDEAESRVAVLEEALSEILREAARCRDDQAYRDFCTYAIKKAQQALHRPVTRK